MSDNFNSDLAMIELLLATSFIDDDIHKAEMETIGAIILGLPGFTEDDLIAVHAKFINASYETVGDLINLVSDTIEAIKDQNNQDFNIACLTAMSAVAVADGVTHPHEQILISECIRRWA